MNFKDTPTDHEIHELIKNRWSPRTFSQKPISQKELQILFEAGRWAPSSNNLQPWNIVWGIKGSETYDRIMDVLVEFNQKWAKNAPVLLLGVVDTKTPKGDDNYHAPHDLGQYMANVAIQAQSMGIALHQMAGLDYKKALKEFKFPDTFHVATAVALGYYGGDLSDVPDFLQEAEEGPRSRKKQNDFVFNGDYHKTADI
jgi:nitroreductase